jgi:NADPH:quinone reductase-like Zn-dependent oxidoreductase
MKAVRLKGFGGNEAVKFEDVEKPDPGKGEILVNVNYAGLNPFDISLRNGLMKDTVKEKLPVTLGGDFSGVVERVGEGVNDFKEGDRVLGYGLFLGPGTGSFAECVTVKSDQAAIIPEGMDMKTAGALPLVGMSAWDVIHNKIKLEKDHKILIHGASGGIGSIAVQMANRMGATVLATSTPSGVDFVRSLGAEKVIDYREENFETVFSNVDAVFDNVGGDVFRRSLMVIKDGGVLVTMVPPSDMSNQERGVRTIGESTQKNISKENLSKMVNYIKDSNIKVNIDRIFDLERATEAFEYYEKEHPLGKVLIKV